MNTSLTKDENRQLKLARQIMDENWAVLYALAKNVSIEEAEAQEKIVRARKRLQKRF